MIDFELAAQALPLLSTVITTLLEDEHLAAARPVVDQGAEQATRLRQLGADITVLAEALGVIVRRSGEAR